MKNWLNMDISQNNIHYIIRYANQDDFKGIQKLWKSNTGPLDACLVKELNKSIDNHECLVAICNNTIVGFCVSHYMKNKKCILIDDICVDIMFRKNGIASKFIDILKQKNKIIIADCFKGEENNTFWEKIGKRIEERERKTDTIYRYLVWCPNKLF